MDNPTSSDIVDQDSNIEATEVETLPPLPTTQASSPPTKSNLSSHYKDMSWRNGAEILANAADFIPGLGTAIKAGVGLGDYSPDARLKEKQFKWAVEEIAKISHKIDILLQKLPPDEQIEAADVAAIINAAMKASEKTADAKKRKLLKNAVVNAFDVEQYQEGLTLRLFKILEQVEYGDVEVLKQVLEESKKQAKGSLIEFNVNRKGSMKEHHLGILINLTLISEYGTTYKERERYHKIVISEMGERLLDFISKPEQ